MAFDPDRSSAGSGLFYDELNHLVESWYEAADEANEKGLRAEYHAYRECADQLAKTIEEHD